MADGHAPFVAILLGTPAYIGELHPIEVFGHVQVEVDIHVEPAGKLEDTVDLAAGIDVGVRRATDQFRPALQRLVQELLGLGLISHALLGEYANLDVDDGCVVGTQLLDSLEPRKPTVGSTSTCVRIRVVPDATQLSSVRAARS